LLNCVGWVFLQQGQTALSIAEKLGYISVVETLKVVTETIVTTTTTTVVEEKFKVVAPETMQEAFISDSEDEAGKSGRHFLAGHLLMFKFQNLLNLVRAFSISI
jgi:hypothetical protein